MEDLQKYFALVASHRALDRERGLASFVTSLNTAIEDGSISEDNREFLEWFHQILDEFPLKEDWESRLAVLEVSKVILEVDIGLLFIDKIIQNAKNLFDDPEARCRLGISEVLQNLSKVIGTEIWQQFEPFVEKSISDNYERANYENPEEKQTVYMHDQEGWKSLETSFICMEGMMRGCGESFFPFLTAKWQDVIIRSLSHTNRFVREIGYKTIRTICEITSAEQLQSTGPLFTSHLKLGLADNWSQVRYAASIATRSFMLCIPPENKEQYYADLLPRMCLNRYYGAEGVRLYSHETWRLVVGSEGKNLVAKYIDEFVEYYCEQADADNHSVREAACKVITELARHIDQMAVKKHISELLESLKYLLKDASWPVRDAACIASGEFIIYYPEESKEKLEIFYDLWFHHLSDNIWSVRETTALALGNVMRAYKEPAVDIICDKIRELLPKAKEQPHDSHILGDYENTTTFGVAAKKRRDNDIELHTGQTVHSCGSLAPRLKRGTDHEDHGFTHDEQPWEMSDGAIYLLRELAILHPERAIEFLDTLAEISRLKGFFAHIHVLLQTIWRQLPKIAQCIGSEVMAGKIEQFIEPLFDSLSSGHRLLESQAGFAVDEMRSLLGDDFDKYLTEEYKNMMVQNEFVYSQVQ
eukprot:TRINITY_DN3297_c1_g1_i1.p1 TRINITY_DN3297_c1_g1~~TRINITY_DN3297_c1_g1_i1.p1  ORF type:complete len:644 (-),score=136.08 TRINITY_DN3297_c1_g1_i1:20-1951(-)